MLSIIFVVFVEVICFVFVEDFVCLPLGIGMLDIDGCIVNVRGVCLVKKASFV